jgi:hypothetical protein
MHHSMEHTHTILLVGAVGFANMTRTVAKSRLVLVSAHRWVSVSSPRSARRMTFLSSHRPDNALEAAYVQTPSIAIAAYSSASNESYKNVLRGTTKRACRIESYLEQYVRVACGASKDIVKHRPPFVVEQVLLLVISQSLAVV